MNRNRKRVRRSLCSTSKESFGRLEVLSDVMSQHLGIARFPPSTVAPMGQQPCKCCEVSGHLEKVRVMRWQSAVIICDLSVEGEFHL